MIIFLTKTSLIRVYSFVRRIFIRRIFIIIASYVCSIVLY